MDTQSRHLNSFLPQGVLESFIDGILIITAQGKIVHSNSRAQQIFSQLSISDLKNELAPREIWHICEYVLENYPMYGEQKVIVQSEIKLGSSNSDSSYRVRSRWLELDYFQPCFLVTLEDQTHFLENKKMLSTEVAQYSINHKEKLRFKVFSIHIKTSLLARILPEDYRADLNTLRHRWIVKQKLPKWVANIRICLFLLAVFKGWLQIKFENIFLTNNRSS